MKYMTDANIAHVAPKLRERGIDWNTVHKIVRNSEYSQESISDEEIAAFLRKAKGAIILIASDIADHPKWDNVPHITWLGRRRQLHPRADGRSARGNEIMTTPRPWDPYR